MKIVQVETLIKAGPFAKSNEWRAIREYLHAEIKAMDHPVGSGKFTLYPESGKKRGKGNGVKPIKYTLINRLVEEHGWMSEADKDHRQEQRAICKRIFPDQKTPGLFDAMLCTKQGNIALEWETGNVSSSHRALNKMGLGLTKGVLIAAVLVVPSRVMYQYLTDRTGNFTEIAPYFDMWRAMACVNGVFEVVAIEHDDTSMDVRKIPKGTDGRALA